MAEARRAVVGLLALDAAMYRAQPELPPMLERILAPPSEEVSFAERKVKVWLAVPIAIACCYQTADIVVVVVVVVVRMLLCATVSIGHAVWCYWLW